MINASIVKVHRADQGAKGGLAARSSALLRQNLVENFFQRIKDYRGIATRYCTETSVKTFIALAATVLRAMAQINVSRPWSRGTEFAIIDLKQIRGLGCVVGHQL